MPQPAISSQVALRRNGGATLLKCSCWFINWIWTSVLCSSRRRWRGCDSSQQSKASCEKRACFLNKELFHLSKTSQLLRSIGCTVLMSSKYTLIMSVLHNHLFEEGKCDRGRWKRKKKVSIFLRGDSGVADDSLTDRTEITVLSISTVQSPVSNFTCRRSVNQ